MRNISGVAFDQRGMVAFISAAPAWFFRQMQRAARTRAR
jgi:hypothetical protein